MLLKQKLGIISRTNFELMKSTFLSLIMMLLKCQNTPQINTVLRMFQLYLTGRRQSVGYHLYQLNLWELKTNPAGDKRRVLVCYWLVKFLLNRGIFGLASAPKSRRRSHPCQCGIGNIYAWHLMRLVCVGMLEIQAIKRIIQLITI